MRYRLIGIDLDGTLLDRHGRVSRRNLEALAAAKRAGVRVVPCTGRAWSEARRAIDELNEHPDAGVDAGVFVGGAAINDVRTGKPLDTADMDAKLAREIVMELHELPEAVLVFRDADRAGHDYLVTGQGSLSANTRWWFEHTQARVHFKKHPTHDDLLHSLRVGIVTGERRMKLVADRLAGHFGPRVVLQWFKAVQMPNPDQSVCVLDVFSAGVDKWRGLQWMAAKHGIDESQIAAIGDEVNDLAMLRAAGCSIAMGNAIEDARRIARYTTLDHNDSGVAHAIENLLAGRWT